MKFVTEMWHPNIYPDGKVWISILHPPGVDEFNEQESADERWRPILGVESVLLSVISMLNDPNLDSPANIDAAKNFREDIESYNKKVKKINIFVCWDAIKSLYSFSMIHLIILLKYNNFLSFLFILSNYKLEKAYERKSCSIFRIKLKKLSLNIYCK